MKKNTLERGEKSESNYFFFPSSETKGKNRHVRAVAKLPTGEIYEEKDALYGPGLCWPQLIQQKKSSCIQPGTQQLENKAPRVRDRQVKDMKNKI